MKKVIFFILIFILICFLLPIIFTNKRNVKETISNIQENNEEVSYNYKEFSNIKLLHNETNEIEELLLDEYLVRSSLCRNACKL